MATRSGLDPNGYHDWPRPFRERDGQTYLTRPWGEQFMQAFYNAYEDRYPIIDNVAAERDAVRFAISREGPMGLVQAVGKFVGFTLLKTRGISASTSLASTLRARRKKRPRPTTPRAGSRCSAAISPGCWAACAARDRQPARRSVCFSHTHGLDVGFELASGSPSGKTRSSTAAPGSAWSARTGCAPRGSPAACRARHPGRHSPGRPAALLWGCADSTPCRGEVPQPEVLYYQAAPGSPGVSRRAVPKTGAVPQ